MVIVFAPYGSTIVLVLSASNIFTKFRCGHHSLMLNISQMATDTAIVTIEGE